MATLVLSAAGAALGGTLGPAGAIAGRAAGALIGGMADSRLFADTQKVSREGPRLKAMDVQASTEGAPIPRLYGRSRLTGQIIWATRFEEVKTTTTESTGGGGKGSKPKPKVETTTTSYSYFASFAVALCEGPVSHFGRIWADGKLLDTASLNIRYYKGGENQLPDSLIEAKVGSGNTPAYRGVAYVVFERLPLANFGNRLPQLSFEVVRAIDSLERDLKAVCIIPGATEFGYDTVRVVTDLGEGRSKAENAHLHGALSDFTISIDELLGLCPNLEQVGLIVPWFGNDLRCGSCMLRPGVELGAKNTQPYLWEVNGISRAQAHQISTIDGRASHGSTPSDASVIRAIQFLKARGLKVVFYPFILMDIPAGNALTDPYSGTAGQPTYPWRGRITLSIAPGQGGTPDNSATAAAEVAAFAGTATGGQFIGVNMTTAYTGPYEWSYRRMVLHYARLCQMAGGVDAFLLGSELVGLTRIRSGRQQFPFVEALQALAGEVTGVLPGAQISYAADWSEYVAYKPQDGLGDLVFPLDRLWGDGNVDFVGIDNYLPLSDWRDGEDHLDAILGVADDDEAYLKAGVASGEYLDWYYADEAGRAAQTRLPISDGDYGKPWVHAAKDLKNWWLNPHYERLGGVEVATPTPWQAQGKPVWFTEFGCPAVDKGANQPNVFYDPKSSESFLPHFSSGDRNDNVQRAYLKAHLAHWAEGGEGNPVSAVYGAPMVNTGNMFVWAWDARPYPAFPFRLSVWADGNNWHRGHWLNGRLGAAPLGGLMRKLAEDNGVSVPVSASLSGAVEGFVLDRPMSFRQAVEGLSGLFGFAAYERDGEIRFLNEGSRLPELQPAMLVEGEGQALISEVRSQESEGATALSLGYVEPARDFRPASLRMQTAAFDRGELASINLPMALHAGLATTIADNWLTRQRTGRQNRTIQLPPTALACEPGDILTFTGETGRWRIDEITDGEARRLSLSRVAGRISTGGAVSEISEEPALVVEPGTVLAEALDLPLLDENADAPLLYLAAHANPWPGGLSVYRETAAATSFAFGLQTPAVMGETLSVLPKGAPWRFHRASLNVKLYSESFESVSDEALFAGANALAVQTGEGWEIIQFGEAELIGERTYRLSSLLRGQKGTEHMMAESLAPGARFVVLNDDLVPYELGLDAFGSALSFRIGPLERTFDHPSYATASETWRAAAQKPLSPVHARARREEGGIRITFIRRTRIGGDSWAFDTQPLGEDGERYEIDILDGEGGVLRTLASTSPEVFYTDELADFGATQASLSLRICQMSGRVGRGTPLNANLPIL